MKISASVKDGVMHLYLKGELDHHGAKEAMASISSKIDVSLPHECVLDMGGITFMDSSGIAVVLKTQRYISEIGGSFAVENVPNQAMRVLDAAGLSRIVNITASIKE